MASPRKFLSEFGLHVCTGYMWLLQQDQLHKLVDLPEDPHIYLVGRRPKITLDPASFAFEGETIRGCFYKQVQDTRTPIPFVARNTLGRTDLIVRSTFPYTEFQLTTLTGETVLEGKSALLLGLCGPEHWSHLDLEVLYVGQSYGEKGSRNAVDRLQSHSTLQGIYAEAIRNAPDQDVWLVLLCFERMMLASFDGLTREYQCSDAEDSAHMNRFFDQPISERQEVNFTEAALIKYFRPDYNVRYKETFPDPAHFTYRECYAVDLNLVSVEVNTEELMLRLWSEAAPVRSVHIASYPLHDESERRSMFALE